VTHQANPGVMLHWAAKFPLMCSVITGVGVELHSFAALKAKKPALMSMFRP
jgi:hypothetical protein